MMPQLIRVGSGLAGALVLAIVLDLLLLGVSGPAAKGAAPQFSPLANALLHVLLYGLPLAALAAALTEGLRIRHWAAYAAFGAALAFVAAHFAVRGEPMNAAAFSGGALASVYVLVIGALSAMAYWAITGRRAGWQGAAREEALRLAAEAFRTASVNARVEHCRMCAAAWSAIGVLLFSLLSWASIAAGSLREGLIEETEYRAKSVLNTAGYTWAAFKVEGSRGVLTGLAPDEMQKRAAFDSVREALAAATGFPGVVAHIDNETVARLPMSEMNEQLAAAAKRESDAKAAAEVARVAAVAARAAEAEAKRTAEEQARAAEAEIKRKLEEQARFAEGELKRKLEEQARLAEAEIKRKLEEQMRAAEEDARQAAAAAASAAAEAAAAAAASAAQAAPAEPEQAPAQTSVEVAAVEEGAGEAAAPPASDVTESHTTTSDPAPSTVREGGTC